MDDKGFEMAAQGGPGGETLPAQDRAAIRRAGRPGRIKLPGGPDLHPLVLVFLSSLSGLLLALSVPNEFFPWGNPLIGLFALSGAFVALSSRPGWKLSLLMGACFGTIAHATSSYWLWYFKDFAIYTLGSTTLVYTVAYGLVFVWLSQAATASPSWRPLLLALGWVAYEFQKSIGFLGYPWGILPYSWNTVIPFIQTADVTGVYGGGLLLALANACISEFVLDLPSLLRPGSGRARRHLASFAATALFFALALAYGAWRLGEPDGGSKTVDVVMVQANEDSWTNGNESKRIQAMMDLTEDALPPGDHGADLILWGENSLSHPYRFSGRGYDYSRIPRPEPLSAFVARHGIPFLTGAPDVDWAAQTASNSVALVDGGGRFVGSYAKMHCVPFAEAVPFAEEPWMRALMAKVMGGEYSGWKVGTRKVIFSIPLSGGGSLRFGAPICFEDAFAGLCRDFINSGAEVLVNLTNDSWSRTDSAEIQHFVAARYRSVENRRILIRSTNGGVSGWVDSKGRLHDPLPYFTASSQRVSIPVAEPRRRTVFSAAGEGFAWAVVFLFAALSLILIFRNLSKGERRSLP